jgi:glycosyltransferase involved in cell wall biosynthesis
VSQNGIRPSRYGTGMDGERSVVLVVPITPAETGNGLAMRAGMLLDALAPVAAVHVVIVPVSGPADGCSWTADRARTVTVVEPVTAEGARDHLTRQLANSELRERLHRTVPLPARATLAPPTLAPTIAAALPDSIEGPAAVLAMRIYLAPLGVYLARDLSAGRAVIDADDDDATLLRSLGDQESACAFDRLARTWLPDADAVFAASEADAAAIAMRAGLDRCDVVPNTVTVPTTVAPRPGIERLLFVGNLTYEPNRLAARLLASEILPAVRRQRPAVTLDLVGPHGGTLDDLGGVEGVRVTGAVADVAPYYASADVVVVPLRHGTGTRIKVLEAFAHGRPVVATPAAVAGLDLNPRGIDSDRTVEIAESTPEIARSVSRLLDEPAEAMIERAARLLVTRYSPTVVAPLLRAAVFGPGADRLAARPVPGG